MLEQMEFRTFALCPHCWTIKCTLSHLAYQTLISKATSRKKGNNQSVMQDGTLTKSNEKKDI